VKQIEVQIMGQGYVLGCPEGGETRLGQAVGKVDEAMCKIRDAGKIKARDRIAVLAALNLAFDLTDRPAAASVSGDSTAPSTDLHNLLQRMDAVLARDNQLI
jgi:cell division protein ZapA